jgi:hypothetical protein
VSTGLILVVMHYTFALSIAHCPLKVLLLYKYPKIVIHQKCLRILQSPSSRGSRQYPPRHSRGRLHLQLSGHLPLSHLRAHWWSSSFSSLSISPIFSSGPFRRSHGAQAREMDLHSSDLTLGRVWLSKRTNRLSAVREPASRP